MARSFTTAALITSLLLGPSGTSLAGSLQVAPVTVEVLAPGNTSALTLQNLGTRELRAQVRVFKWSKGADGSDVLQPTSDMVASPPAATLTPKTNYTVRLVRTAKRPITSEESYRVFVDELPDPALMRNGVIGVVLRQSIPVFFAVPDRARPQVEWSLTQSGGQLSLIAANSGGRRVQVSEVALQTQNGRVVTFGKGLVGYALAESTSSWSKPVDARLAGPVTLKAQTDLGPLDVKTHIKAP